ncbi:MAG: hypothetical protein LBL96_07290 [Clostridiales bacterium]|jgi:hypothetical protein|nr:hypothetical protein [Clostridiales bacterium]
MYDNPDNHSDICQIFDVKTIKQSTYYYCAAACVKMCLDTPLSQEEIFDNLKRNTLDQENWYAEPDSVYIFLSNHNQYIRTSEISDSSLDATEWIVSCMIERNSCAPMLVSGGKHWVLYAGYQMNSIGEPRGIYIRDPWPTTASLTFFPFSRYFFDEYFRKINVEGKWKDKVESFIPSKTEKFIKLNIFEKPHNGGINNIDITFFKKQIICDDLTSFGFSKIGFLKNGGINFEDLIIYDKNDSPKFFLTPTEVDNYMTLTAIDANTLSVIGFLEMRDIHLEMFDKHRITSGLKSRHNIDIQEKDIKFIYDRDISSSCFDPIIEVKGIGNFDLSLSQH